MEMLKRCEAFKRAVAAFGPWGTWSRAQNLAYGLIRGVPYSAMEKCSNDNPPSYEAARCLMKLGAWPAMASQPYGLHDDVRNEVSLLIQWVRKPIRVKVPRGTKVEAPALAAEE